MPKYSTVIDLNGFRAILCHSGRKPLYCSSCGATANRLCDEVISNEPGNLKTCDKPVCAKCTWRVGQSTDYCKEHAPRHEFTADEIKQIETPQIITLRYWSKCFDCHRKIQPGTKAKWFPNSRQIQCRGCAEKETQPSLFSEGIQQ